MPRGIPKNGVNKGWYIKGIIYSTSFKKGNIPWTKGNPRAEETKRKISHANKGSGNGMFGKHHSEEIRNQISNALLGEKSPNWKGGVTSQNKIIREGIEYKLWREKIFKRDNYTCIWCGAKSGNGKTIILNAHHIKPFYKYIELRFAIDNGITLCIKCHEKTYGRPKINNRKEIKMVSQGIEKMMDLIFTETKLTNNDLKVIIGELANHFGEREVLNAVKQVVREREESRIDHIMGDAEPFDSQEQFDESQI